MWLWKLLKIWSTQRDAPCSCSTRKKKSCGRVLHVALLKSDSQWGLASRVMLQWQERLWIFPMVVHRDRPDEGSHQIAYSDSRFNRTVDMKTGYRTRNILCVPMRNATGEIIGVTQVINKLPESSSFGRDDEQQLSSFSALGNAFVLIFLTWRSCCYDWKIEGIQGTSRITWRNQ